MYSPISMERLGFIFMANVIGRNNATAIVVESPGIAPKINPIITPSTIKRKFIGVIAAMLAIIFSTIIPFTSLDTMEFLHEAHNESHNKIETSTQLLSENKIQLFFSSVFHLPTHKIVQTEKYFP